MLKYKADSRTLGIVATYFIIAITSWFMFDKVNYWLIGILMALNAVFAFFSAVIVHNTIHAPIFKSKRLNSIFQIILSLTYGHPVSAFEPGHNHSHHRSLSTPKDVMRPSKARFKLNFFNHLFFFFLVANTITKSEIAFVKKMYKEERNWFFQYLKEFIVVFGIKIILLIIDPVKAILLIIIPHFYAVWGIVSTNFWQHDGCDTSHPYNHSRNFKSKLLNFWTCNNGYHGMHHMNPGLHWSLLPAAHKEHLEPHLHPNLNLDSLFKHLWKATIYPGKRLDYLGNAVVFEKPIVPDEDWIEDIVIDKGKVSFSSR